MESIFKTGSLYLFSMEPAFCYFQILKFRSLSCRTAALSHKIVVLNFGEVTEMNKNKRVMHWYEERQYLKVIMECFQYLVCQGIPLGGNDDDNDNFTQLLLLRGTDPIYIVE